MPSSRFDNRAASPAALVAALSVAAFLIPTAPSAQSFGISSPFLGPTQPPPSTALPTEPMPRMRDSFGIIGLRRAEALAARGAAAAPEPLYGRPVTNFGRPRKQLTFPPPYPPPQRAYPAPFSPQTPLPPLEPYRSSAQAKTLKRQKAEDIARRRPLLVNPAYAALPAFPIRPRPRVIDRPYDALGIGIGSMRLRPYLEASYGFDDNANRLVLDPRGSRFIRSDIGMQLSSEWSNHSFVGAARFGYYDFIDYQSANRPDGEATGSARYDITRNTAALFDAKFNLDTQRPGSPNLVFNLGDVVAINRPFIYTMAGSAGLRHRFNRLEITARGAFDRQMYQDAKLSDGTTLDLSSTDYNTYGGIIRAAYEISPNLKPFVEAKLDTRLHDWPVDTFGYYRDSQGYSVKGGAEFRISDLLRGEAAGGYANRNYADPRLINLNGPTIDAALYYTPSALTMITLKASTNLYETTAGGAAGVFNRTFSAEISHDFSRNFNATALVTYYTNDYQGSTIFERGFSGRVRLEYKIARQLYLRASYTHEKLSSTTPTADYSDNTYLIGLRFQL